MRRLPAWLAQHLAFDSDGVKDEEQTAHFWRTMGIDASVLDKVVEVNPWWSEGFLWVNGNLASDPEVVEKVSFVLMYVCKWRRFCDSRWATVGPCCRVLLWGLAVGLESWVSFTRSDKEATDYHLHGFAKLSPKIKRLCCVANVASHVCDAVLSEALSDDRLARRADELKAIMHEELLWVEGIDDAVWDRLASMVGPEQEGAELAHAGIHASHVQAAYANNRLFRVLDAYPWS